MTEKNKIISRWISQVITEQMSPKNMINEFQTLIHKYSTAIRCQLMDELCGLQKACDERTEAEQKPEKEDKKLHGNTQVTAAVKVVKEKETTTASPQNIFTVSEKLEIKQEDPIKEISMDSSRQASSDKSLVITERSSPQEKEKTALKKTLTKAESKLTLKEEKKDVSDFVKKITRAFSQA